MIEQIEEMKARAIQFLAKLDQAANDCGLSIVSLQEGHFIFKDQASGLEVKAALKVAEQPDSVPSKATVGEPGITFTPPKGKLN